MHKHYFLPKVAAIEPYIRSFSSSSAKSFHVLKILPTFLPSKKKKPLFYFSQSLFKYTLHHTLHFRYTLSGQGGFKSQMFSLETLGDDADWPKGCWHPTLNFLIHPIKYSNKFLLFFPFFPSLFSLLPLFPPPSVRPLSQAPPTMFDDNNLPPHCQISSLMARSATHQQYQVQVGPQQLVKPNGQHQQITLQMRERERERERVAYKI